METLEQLQARREICLVALRMIDQAKNDPRQIEALTEYNRQLTEIDRRIAEITGTPPPVVIGLKAAQITARVPR